MTFSPSLSAAFFQPARSAGLARPQTSGMQRGFTLVELMVVFVIISILAGLTLAGLVGTRQRAKIDKTRTTIRKISEAIGPQYESYLRRRLPFVSTANRRTNAFNRLSAIRTQMMFEMPDSWNDLWNNVAPPSQTVQQPLPTAPIIAYRASKPAVFGDYSSAECLYIILARSGWYPDIMEQFHSAEIGDKDKNGAPEFWDGWGNPISFIRWAPGFSSPVQSANSPDPMDPQRVDTAAYALIPLIVSAGPDGDLGLNQSTGWSSLPVITKSLSPPPTPSPLLSLMGSGPLVGQSTSSASLDNVTNHDLVTK